MRNRQALKSIGLPDLSVRELQAAVAIAERGSFVAAARQLHMALPTLSRVIKRLEKTLGVLLFERSTRRVTITSAGSSFVAVAQRLLSDLQLSLTDLGDVAAEQRGQVVVSAFPVFAQEILPAVLKKYLDTRPDIQLHLHTGRFPEVLQHVSSGVSDFGVAYLGTLPESIHRINLWREPLFVVVPQDHPFGRSAKAHVTLADLSRTPLVSLPPETHTRRFVDGAAAAQGISLRHSVIVPTFLDILNHVSAGVGSGIVPAGLMSDRFLTNLKVLSLKRPPLSLTVGLIALKKRHLSPAALALMRMLLESVTIQQANLRTRLVSMGLPPLEQFPKGSLKDHG